MLWGADMKRFWWILLIILILGGMGACAWQFVGVFKNVQDFQSFNDGAAADFVENGMPPPGDEIYSLADGGWDPEDIRQISAFVEVLGPPARLEPSVCSFRTQTSTTDLSGQFAECTTWVFFDSTDTYVATPGLLEMTWRKEDGFWRLLYVNYTLQDRKRALDVLNEIEAPEELRVDEPGAPQMDEGIAPPRQDENPITPTSPAHQN